MGIFRVLPTDSGEGGRITRDPKMGKTPAFPPVYCIPPAKPAGRALSALPLPISLGGSIQCTSRLGDGTHLNANVNGVPLHWK